MNHVKSCGNAYQSISICFNFGFIRLHLDFPLFSRQGLFIPVGSNLPLVPPSPPLRAPRQSRFWFWFWSSTTAQCLANPCALPLPVSSPLLSSSLFPPTLVDLYPPGVDARPLFIMLLKPATPLTILLLVAFALLLLSVISTPIVKGIPIATFENVDYGVFGYCKGSKCTDIHVGYTAGSYSSRPCYRLVLTDQMIYQPPAMTSICPPARESPSRPF